MSNSKGFGEGSLSRRELIGAARVVVGVKSSSVTAKRIVLPADDEALGAACFLEAHRAGPASFSRLVRAIREALVCPKEDLLESDLLWHLRQHCSQEALIPFLQRPVEDVIEAFAEKARLHESVPTTLSALFGEMAPAAKGFLRSGALCHRF